MDINPQNLQTAGIAFNAAFTRGLGQVASQYARIATTVPSATSQNEYGWLGMLPNIREWLGDRVINNITQSGYAIKNKSFELTIKVDRDDIDDDNLGIYAPLFEEMGRSVAAFPDTNCFGLLKAGFTTPCYDGQSYFDTDHPVLDENGNTISVSNTGGGSGEPWFLIDDTRALKPIIYQVRRPFTQVNMDKPDDPNVFSRKEFLYGVDGRMNFGFGFWQFAYGSRQPLTPASYAAARAALMTMKGDYGRPLGIMPKLLLVGGSNESAGLKILNNELDSAGGTNEWKGTAELMVSPWL